MKPKVAVIGLAVVVVVFVLMLVYGATRPDGVGVDPRPGVERALGWLQQTRTLTFDDLAAADPPCLDRSARQIEVAAGLSCKVSLPDSGSLTLCTVQGSATAVVDGTEYPAQRFGPGELGCAAPPSINLYDSASNLTVACAFGETCLLAVPEQ